jgi:hypothetical protein
MELLIVKGFNEFLALGENTVVCYFLFSAQGVLTVLDSLNEAFWEKFFTGPITLCGTDDLVVFCECYNISFMEAL